MRRLFLLLTLVGAILTAFTGVVLAQQNPSDRSNPSAQKGSAHLAAPGEAKPLCPEPNSPNKSRCFAQMLIGSKTALSSATPDVVPSGYWPSDLQSAYNLSNSSSTEGTGETVAIVDAFDNPIAEQDLQTYRNQFDLPECSSANGCFTKVDQRGGTNYPPVDEGWAVEIALDLDMVSAICPKCKILLVEADDDYDNNMDAGVDEAANLGANAISNSWGGSEDPSIIGREQHFNHPGIAITASSGDQGFAAGPIYPATSRFVTAVGGTSLINSGRQWSETAWSGAGSGCSAFIAKPPWQRDTGCSNRTEADVSADADPQTGVAVYEANNGGWIQIGGTSASSPIIASVYALAGNASSIKDGSFPYSHTSSLLDITSGSNGNCSSIAAKKTASPTHKKGKHKGKKKHHKNQPPPPHSVSYLCNAVPGYDGPTGLGTPNGTGAF